MLPHTHLRELHMLLSLSHRLPTSSHPPGAGTPSPHRPAAQHHKCSHTRQPVLGNGFTPVPSCLIPFFCPHLSFSSNWLCPGCFPCLLFIQHVYITYVLYALMQHHHPAVHHHFKGLSPKAILMLVPSRARGGRPCSAPSCTPVLKYKCSIAGIQLLRGNL